MPGCAPARTVQARNLAAQLFLVGTSVRAGLAGPYPSLAPENLFFRGDLQFTVDFHSVYALVREYWLQTKSGPIVGHDFPVLNVV